MGCQSEMAKVEVNKTGVLIRIDPQFSVGIAKDGCDKGYAQ